MFVKINLIDLQSLSVRALSDDSVHVTDENWDGTESATHCIFAEDAIPLNMRKHKQKTPKYISLLPADN